MTATIKPLRPTKLVRTPGGAIPLVRPGNIKGDQGDPGPGGGGVGGTVVPASETTAGISRFATSGELDDGSSTSLATSPAKVARAISNHTNASNPHSQYVLETSPTYDARIDAVEAAPPGGKTTVKTASTTLLARTYLKVIGAGATVTDDAANDQVILTFPGSSIAKAYMTADYTLAAGQTIFQNLTDLQCAVIAGGEYDVECFLKGLGQSGHGIAAHMGGQIGTAPAPSGKWVGPQWDTSGATIIVPTSDMPVIVRTASGASSNFGCTPGTMLPVDLVKYHMIAGATGFIQPQVAQINATYKALNVTTSNGSVNIGITGAVLNSTDTGAILVGPAGIPVGATITFLTSTTATLSAAATAAGTNVAMNLKQFSTIQAGSYIRAVQVG